MKFESKHKTFDSCKCICKCRLQNVGHFVQGGDEFTFYPSALRAGGVLSSRSGRAGGLMDFLGSKFYGIV